MKTTSATRLLLACGERKSRTEMLPCRRRGQHLPVATLCLRSAAIGGRGEGLGR